MLLTMLSLAVAAVAFVLTGAVWIFQRSKTSN